jgi:hypothetical protein
MAVRVEFKEVLEGLEDNIGSRDCFRQDDERLT